MALLADMGKKRGRIGGSREERAGSGGQERLYLLQVKILSRDFSFEGPDAGELLSGIASHVGVLLLCGAVVVVVVVVVVAALAT